MAKMTPIEIDTSKLERIFRDHRLQTEKLIKALAAVNDSLVAYHRTVIENKTREESEGARVHGFVLS